MKNILSTINIIGTFDEIKIDNVHRNISRMSSILGKLIKR
jgi:hypothetical protein